MQKLNAKHQKSTEFIRHSKAKSVCAYVHVAACLDETQFTWTIIYLYFNGHVRVVVKLCVNAMCGTRCQPN